MPWWFVFLAAPAGRPPAATGLTFAGSEVDYRIWRPMAGNRLGGLETPRARGGIGRRARLRALCPQGRAGSTPVGPTWCGTRRQRVPRNCRGPRTPGRGLLRLRLAVSRPRASSFALMRRSSNRRQRLTIPAAQSTPQPIAIATVHATPRRIQPCSAPVVQDAINDQINNELFSSYQYLSMAAWCEHEQFIGCANWLRIQSQEEYGHAMRLYDFLLARNCPGQAQADRRARSRSSPRWRASSRRRWSKR